MQSSVQGQVVFTARLFEQRLEHGREIFAGSQLR